MTNIDNLNNNESSNQSTKTSKFIENTKKAVRDTLMKTWIGVSSMMPTATTTTPSIVPASVNTITAIAPIASTTVKSIGLGTAASLFSACGGGENEPEEVKDITPPNINLNQTNVDITGGKEIKINGNQLYIGDILVASRSDNKTKNCKVELSLNGKTISSGTTISEEGTLSIKVSDEANNSKNVNIKLSVEQDVSGLENLKNLSLKVDQEINLLNGVTFGNGAELVKVDIELDGQKVEISDPSHYTPEYPGTCNIILTVKNKNGESTEYKVDNLIIKPLEYKSIEIRNIKPKEILPIVGQVESGDKKVYEHIEHLRIAEATRIRDMMWEYGAGNYSPEEYQQLMMRLNTGMIGENPKGYNNFEIMGNYFNNNPSDHAHNERNILNTLINHTNFKIVDTGEYKYEMLYNLSTNNVKNINIFGESTLREGTKNEYLNGEFIRLKRDLLKLKNFILLGAGTNIDKREDGTIKNKIYQENTEINNEHGIYADSSIANGENDNAIDKHLLVTIGTNADGNVDQTNEIYGGSKFPVGFNNKILFAGRAFPIFTTTNKIIGEDGRYSSSYPNYVNLAMTDICFQMKADTPDADKLLEMIRSTSLTDYISLDGQTQPLQLINPAGFFKKYLMPIDTDLPQNIESNQNPSLEKGYYKLVIFDIPGAEVKVNGQWIAYNDANKSLIKNQNPKNLEWRINGNLCKKMGYGGKTIKGKIIPVDDQWNGLNMDKEFSISIQ